MVWNLDGALGTPKVQDLLAAMMISGSGRTVLPPVIAGAARFQ
jgi:hypothetical protein